MRIREINEFMCMVAQIWKNQYYQVMLDGLHVVCFSLTLHDVLNIMKGLQPYRCKYFELHKYNLLFTLY